MLSGEHQMGDGADAQLGGAARKRRPGDRTTQVKAVCRTISRGTL
jgi:hypothetical protein